MYVSPNRWYLPTSPQGVTTHHIDKVHRRQNVKSHTQIFQCTFTILLTASKRRTVEPPDPKFVLSNFAWNFSNLRPSLIVRYISQFSLILRATLWGTTRVHDKATASQSRQTHSFEPTLHFIFKKQPSINRDKAQSRMSYTLRHFSSHRVSGTRFSLNVYWKRQLLLLYIIIEKR